MHACKSVETHITINTNVNRNRVKNRVRKRLLATRCVWAGTAADKACWCPDCQYCQQAWTTCQPCAPVQQIPIPYWWFSHLNVDLESPLPCASDGSNHLLTVVDHSCRWMEWRPCPLLPPPLRPFRKTLSWDGSWRGKFQIRLNYWTVPSNVQ